MHNHELYYAWVRNIRRTFVVMLQFFLSCSNDSEVVKNLFASGHIAYMRELTCISPFFFASVGARRKFPDFSFHGGYEVISWNVKCVGGWNAIFDIVLMGVAEYSMKHSFSHYVMCEWLNRCGIVIDIIDQHKANRPHESLGTGGSFY